MLVEWNDAASVVSSGRALHELFEAQAKRTPAAVAVELGEEKLTYAELDRRANQLARYLIHRFAAEGPRDTETRVGLCVERDLSMVVAVLGILKSGAAYVPLDPSYPDRRLHTMVESAGCRAILTRKRLLKRLSEEVTQGGAVTVVCLDDAARAIAHQPTLPPQVCVDPASLAYVMFTSGSTGRPKAIAMPHGPLVGLVAWQIHHSENRARSAQARARTLQFAPLSFDVSCQEIFATLGQGGAVVLINEELRRDPTALWRWLAKAAVGRLFLPFVALRQLAEAVADDPRRAAMPRALEEIVTAGEALQITPAVAALFSRLAGCRLENQYGPTESHVATAHPLAGYPDGWPRLPPIGRPIPGVNIVVLDPLGHLVPAGSAGELHLGGTALARGYLGAPALTAERFLPDPFAGLPGSRRYRTGDLGRYLADGSLEFLGRIDDQVKLRGYRIEPGEIERVAATHPAVRQAVAVVQPAANGEASLVLYTVLGETAIAGQIREHLSERLPEFMVPSAVVPLGALPLTPSGKVDRRRLPAPVLRGTGKGRPTAPRTATEALLAELWSDVLAVEEIGVGESFFDLGGHSLKATRLISRLREACGVELPVRAVFDAPTIAGLASRVESGLRAARVATIPAPERVASRPRKIPLSFGQERLWFLDRLGAGPAYNVAEAQALSGTLDIAVLRASLNGIAERHEALRTSFPEVFGEPRQEIAATFDLPLPVVDLAALPRSAVDREALRLATAEALRRFDLGRGPLLRGRLLRLGADRHLLLLTLHHAVIDGWSIDTLYRELSALYRAHLSGRVPGLPALPIQYADYALWQRRWLTAEALEGQLSYWRRHLAGELPVLALPTDRQRPPVRSYRGGHHDRSMPQNVCDRLEVASRRQSATPAIAFQAAFKALLWRLTGSGDLVIGSPIANRTYRQLEHLIGFFVNTLAMRSNLADDPSFQELLGRERETALAAYEHQDLPFERLVQDLQPHRDLSQSPLFQALLVVQNNEREPLDLPGIEVEPFATATLTTHFDLELHLEEDSAGWSSRFVYDTDLFDATTIARIAEHFLRLLAGAAAAPDQQLSSLPLLGAAERQQLLIEWNDSRRSGPAGATIHQLFAEQAARTPNAVALAVAEQALTYAELDRRANRLAHHLIRHGVGPEVLVGIAVERGLEMVVGLLGILKAGGAYVPLDPEYPEARLAFMLNDTRAPVVLTQTRLEAKLHGHRAKVLRLDADRQVIAAESSAPPAVEVTAEHLAYVIYTSGSTGRPKGVAIAHRGVVRLVRDTHFADLGPGETFLQFAPISFDASTFELWGSLLNGARLEVFPPHSPSLEELGCTLVERGVSTLWLTSALFQQMVGTQAECLARVRQLLAGGETLPPAHVERMLAVLPAGHRLVNGYGPTENTTFTCCHVMTAASPIGRTVPVGRPIADSGVYLLDERLSPVPVGPVGELWASGRGLARSYLNDPRLTASKLVPSPFGEEPGSRLYRIGDRARLLNDGTVELLGRIDHQVKVRGFRIELGEIEATLNRHPRVGEAVVLAREDETGSACGDLVAYVVATGAEAGLVAELCRYLGEHLPHYMLPSAVVRLDTLPLTPNGKVDRAALGRRQLSAEELRRPGRGRPAAPRTSTEMLLAGLWREVLGVEEIGVHDSFFELGGHSLKVTRLISRLRASLGTELPVHAVFDAPTIAELALRVEAAQGLGRAAKAPIEPRRRSRSRLSFAQERLWFLDRMEPGNAAFNLPIALRLRGPTHPEPWRRAIEEIVRRHHVLRARFREHRGETSQEVVTGTRIPLPSIDLRRLDPEPREQELERRCHDDALTPFDLTRGPLLRARLLRLGDEDHVLQIDLHHIAGDGWSMNVLVQELAALYGAFTAGRPSPLPDLAVQYTDYAEWQREWLIGDELERQLEYWRGQLGAGVLPLELPTDRPRPAVQTFRGESIDGHLDAPLTARLRALAATRGATLFMILLTSFKILLGRLSGQREITVGIPVAGRQRVEIEGLIGLFLNTLVLRTDLGVPTTARPTFVEALRRVREVTLGAYSHQDVPFERLLMELQPARDRSRTPLFQVFFNMLELGGGEPTFPGLETEPVEIADLPSKFDLTVYVSPRARGIDLELVYNADLFDRARMIDLLEQYTALLAQVAARPEERIGRYSLVTERAHQVLPDPRAALDAAWRGTVSEIFAHHAERDPGRPAVVDRDGSADYGRLDAVAGELAAALTERGVGRGDRVAIWARREATLVAALLGVLEAGAAFVLLDPAHPAPRSLEMLRLARPKVWIDLPGDPPPGPLAETLEAGLVPWRLELPERAAWPRRRTVPRRRPEISADDLAYVAFTSGSTGGPKGIAGRHGSLSQFVPWQRDAFELGPDDRFSMLSGLAHDPLHRDVFTPLQLGATIVVPEPGELLRPGWLAGWMARERITVAHLTPAMARLLTDVPPSSAEPLALRWAFFVGDVLTGQRVAKLAKLAPRARAVNTFGATETQRAVSFHPIETGAEKPLPQGSLPLGRGIPGVQLLVLGAEGRLAGVGELGELCMRSPSVALGYLDDPAATAERFVPDPVGSPGGGRLYRTGDLGRYLPSGDAVFVRRTDHQLNIRGYRVEPSEVEAVLIAHPGVRDAVVDLVEADGGEAALVAWVVPRQGSGTTAGELEARAAEHLPTAMVPTIVLPLDTLPLTANRKLDRAELHRGARAALAEHRPGGYLAPRNAIEAQFVSLWEQALRKNPIGVTTNFFDLGGHSLLALRLFALIERSFGQALPIATLFQAPTVEQLARVLADRGHEARFRSLVPIQPWGARPPLFCVHGITGDPFIYRHLAQYLDPEQPLYGLLAKGFGHDEEPFTRIEDMAAHYLREIRGLQPRGPYFLGGFCFGGLVASEMARQLLAEGEQIALLAIFDAHAAITGALPLPVLRRYRREQLARRARHHLRHLRQKSWRERLGYTAETTGRLLGRLLLRRGAHGAAASGSGDSGAFPSVEQANRLATRRYAPGSYPGKATVFVSVESIGYLFDDPQLGWQVLATGGLEIHEIPGLHHEIFDEPHVRMLAERLRAALETAQAEPLLARAV